MADPRAGVLLSCLDERTLNAFVNGELSGDPSFEARVAEHIESCPACQLLLNRLQEDLPGGPDLLLALQAEQGSEPPGPAPGDGTPRDDRTPPPTISMAPP